LSEHGVDGGPDLRLFAFASLGEEFGESTVWGGAPAARCARLASWGATFTYRIVLPVAAVSFAATSAMVSASGPVSGYVLPSCPAPVRTAAATRAMSPTSTDAIFAFSIGRNRVPLATIEGTCRK
jgi:hypothetical protein